MQLIGGASLHWGNIAEIKTGEGKTLVATLPSYLNALEGKGVHVITVNDYLASYQSELMGRIYRFLGMSVGCIVTGQKPAERRKQYNDDMVLMYDQISCKGMDGLRGVFEEQAAARGVHMLWVAQDLLASRTISKRDMRRQVNLYMQTVMGEEPVRPDLVDFDDELTW